MDPTISLRSLLVSLNTLLMADISIGSPMAVPVPCYVSARAWLFRLEDLHELQHIESVKDACWMTSRGSSCSVLERLKKEVLFHSCVRPD